MTNASGSGEVRIQIEDAAVVSVVLPAALAGESMVESLRSAGNELLRLAEAEESER